MAEAVVRRAVEAFMARDLDGILAVADEEIVLLGARVEAAKIKFFGFFRTEEDALAAVNTPPR